jgi:uncharacterized protein
MHPDTQLVSQLQSIDQQVLALEKEIATLPKHIAAIEKTLDSHRRRLEADRAALAANQKDRKLMEGEIALHQQKMSKLRDQMTGAKTNEQYKAFQHEIEFLETAIRTAEDKILEYMSSSETLDANVKTAEAALNVEKKAVEGEQKAARERTAADQSQLQQLRAERIIAAKALPAPTLALYERIRKKWNGMVMAEATNGRCSACQIILRPQFYQDLKRSEDLMTCESCGRILVYNPPVAFDTAQP